MSHAQSRGNEGKSHGRGGKGNGKGNGSGGRSGGGGGYAQRSSSDLPAHLDAISKELGQLLRHKGVSGMRADGYAPLTSVVAALRSKPTCESVEAVVRTSRRGGGTSRFETTEEGGAVWIRATDKHSIQTVHSVGQSDAGANAQGNSKANKHGSSHNGRQREPRRSETDSQAQVELLQAEAERLKAEVAARRKSSGSKIEMILGQAKKDFDASGHGQEYISLQSGEPLTLHKHVEEDTGWAFGATEHGEGWFPACLWEPLPGSSPGTTAVESSAETPDALLEELKAAKLEIASLQAELKTERAISAGLRQSLAEADLAKRTGALPAEASCAREKLSAASFSDSSEAITNPDASQLQGVNSYKEMLLAYLSKAFPDIKNKGLHYDIVEKTQDAKGVFCWKARVELTQLGMMGEGQGASKQEAEQSAALELLRELGGSEHAWPG